jgi:glycosyltransferase involved in cell wall biosynthesis
MRMQRVAVIDTSGQALFRHRGPVLAGLARHAASVIALAPNDYAYAGMTSEEMATGFRLAGATFLPVAFDRLGTNPLKDAATLASLVGILVRQAPELVLSFTVKGTILGSIAAATARVPRRFAVLPGLGYVFGEHARRRRLLRWSAHSALRVSLRLNQRVFVQNPDHVQLLADQGFTSRAGQCVFVPGAGVDPLSFTYVPPPPGPPTFLFMSRLYTEKGICDFVDAARIVRRRSPNAQFQILGALDDSPGCVSKEEVRRWTDEGCVRYLGHASDVRPYLAQCTVFVLPSYYNEGLPSSIVEAMLTGRPVITTDWPGCREPVQEGVNGLLVRPRDPSELARAMEFFLDSPQAVHEMGRIGRRLAVERFTSTAVVDSMLKAMDLQ